MDLESIILNEVRVKIQNGLPLKEKTTNTKMPKETKETKTKWIQWHNGGEMLTL